MALASCTTPPGAGPSYDEGLQELLRMLDKDFQQSDVYLDEKLQRISRIHPNPSDGPMTEGETYVRNALLYKEFFPFQFDSAFCYINENLHLAEELDDKVMQAETTVELALLFTVAGMYLEAKEILDSQVDTTLLSQDQLIRYYSVQHRFNRDFHENSMNPKMSAEAAGRLDWYAGRLFELLPQDSDDRLFLITSHAIQEQQYELADSVNSVLLGRVEEYNRDFAMYAYAQALIDKALGRETFLHWFVKSAIADNRSAVKDNASVAMLALQLFEDEDVHRAFRYITVAHSYAIFFNGKLRPWQLAHIMPLIEAKYYEKAASADRLMLILTVFLGLFSLVVLVFAVILYKMYRKARKRTAEIRTVNVRLSELNTAVTEANSVKEEYIAMLLSMCSDYIDRLESMQQDIKRRLTVGLEAELLKELSTSKLMKHELDKFYNMFDSTFLRLYPDFVAEFNQLLREDERIPLPKNGLLNTELRIFALIRLGITDSSRIALLLRYSVQTIYNYRMKMKKRSIYDREEFEQKLRTIGSFRH